MTIQRARDLDLRRVLRVVRRRAVPLALLVLAASTVAYTLADRQPRLYQSTASVRIGNPNSENVFQSGAFVPVDPRRQVETETQIIQSNDIRRMAAARLGPDAGGIRRVSVSNPPNTDLLGISVTSTSPELARQTADAYADAYVQRRRERAAAELDRRSRELRDEAERLGGRIRAIDEALRGPEGRVDEDGRRAERATLQNQQGTASNLAFQLGAQAALITGAVEVADRAQEPTTPVAPRPRRDAVLAGLLALLGGIGLALLADRLDDRITEAADLADAAPGVPLLAGIPVHGPGRGRRRRRRFRRNGPRPLAPRDPIGSEAYRNLRSSIRYSTLGRTKHVLMVTSATGSEGKTTVTANLAVALAEGGQRVVVVSADLRRPAIAPVFDVAESGRGDRLAASSAGLTSVLHGERTLDECLVPVTLPGGQRLYLLPAGPLPADPAELLGSPAMGSVIAGLRRADIDYVLVDCPPVLPVSDPLGVAQHVDGTVVVVAAGRTRRRDLSATCERLGQVGADIVGLVLNGTATPRSRYVYRDGTERDEPLVDLTERSPLVGPVAAVGAAGEAPAGRTGGQVVRS